MTGLKDNMDRFERRAFEIEWEQQLRFEAGGSHREFWNSRYEQMQSFLIERYRKMSKTYISGDPIVEQRTAQSVERLPRNAQWDDLTSDRAGAFSGNRAAQAS